MKKKVSLFLAMVMMLSALTACGTKPSGDAATNAQPGGNTDAAGGAMEPIKILSEITGGKDPEEHVLWQKEFSEKSGVPIEMTVVSGEDYGAKLAAALASGTDFDVVYMLTSQFDKVSGTGLFEPLTDYIAASPVLSDEEAFPVSEWDRIRQSDGNVYGVFSKNEGGLVPLYRGDWLKTLGLKVPTTLDECYKVFQAFTEQDPDGNGKNDTYGLTVSIAPSGIEDIQPFMSAFGVRDSYMQDAEGKWYLPLATEAAIPGYDWLAKLYKDGYLDPNFATNGDSKCREMFLTGKVGSFPYWVNWVGILTNKAQGEDSNTPMEVVPGPPMLDQDGNGILRAGQNGAWYIMKNCKDKDSAFKAIEFMHSEEGMRMLSLGVEGHDYTLEDGKPVYTEVGAQHSSDHGANTAKSTKFVDPFGRLPAEQDANALMAQYGQVQTTREMTENAMEIVMKYSTRAIMGEITAADAVADMQKELRAKKYID